MKIGEQITTKIRSRFQITALPPLMCAILAVGAVAMFVAPDSSAQKSKPAAPKQFIYSLSQQPSSSQYLGVTGVPAYINYGSLNRRGIYVTATDSSGSWREIGLTRGTMLLSLDNRVTDTPRAADNYLSSKGGGLVEASIVVMKGGAPQVVSASFRCGGGISGLGAPTPVTNGEAYRKQLAPGTKVSKAYSVSELEKYGLQLINESRRSEGQGAGSVSENSSLTTLARTYAEYLLRTGNKSHYDLEGRSPQDRAKAMGIKVGVYENFTWDGGTFLPDERGLIADAHGRMMAEPKNQENHRYNILMPSHQYVGVGVAKDAHNIYMVHEFSDSSP